MGFEAWVGAELSLLAPVCDSDCSTAGTRLCGFGFGSSSVTCGSFAVVSCPAVGKPGKGAPPAGKSAVVLYVYPASSLLSSESTS